MNTMDIPSEQDDADVLDRMVGEQALQIMLHEGVEHAEEASWPRRPVSTTIPHSQRRLPIRSKITRTMRKWRSSA